MNRAICVNTWRQFKSNNVRLILLTLLILAPLAHFTWRRCTYEYDLMEDMISYPFVASLFALIWGVGVISCERQHGTISLVLARPLTVSRYVLSKWFAVGFAASLCSLQCLFVEHAVSVILYPPLLSNLDFVANGLERVILAFGTASMLIFYSSLVTGLKDLALIVGTLFAGMVGMQFLRPILISEVCMRGAGTAGQQFMTHLTNVVGSGFAVFFFPNIPVSEILNGSNAIFTSTINFVCVVTVCLSLAIFFLSRKEFSYGQD